jgi:hypothetical protein
VPTDAGEARRDDAAARFRDALDGTQDAAEPELLPIRLAEAASVVLPVDGAGLSLFDSDFRVPLGASSELVGAAERLQFTQGQGPCMVAGRDGRILASDARELARDWPLYARELFERTPFRAVLTVPLPITAKIRGALDLFLVDESELGAVRLSDASRVADEIAQTLQSVMGATVVGRSALDPDIEWLASPAAQMRTLVWLAMGLIMARFDVGAVDALAILRGYAYAGSTVVDEVAGELVAGTLDLEKLRP